MTNMRDRNPGSPIGQRYSGQCRRDMTLTEALADPMVQAFMSADGVNARQLEADLRELARNKAGATADGPKATLP
jgi:hypothetical protein